MSRLRISMLDAIMELRRDLAIRKMALRALEKQLLAKTLSEYERQHQKNVNGIYRRAPKRNTKEARVIERLLLRPQGVTRVELLDATGWKRINPLTRQYLGVTVDKSVRPYRYHATKH